MPPTAKFKAGSLSINNSIRNRGLSRRDYNCWVDAALRYIIKNVNILIRY